MINQKKPKTFLENLINRENNCAKKFLSKKDADRKAISFDHIRKKLYVKYMGKGEDINESSDFFMELNKYESKKNKKTVVKDIYDKFKDYIYDRENIHSLIDFDYYVLSDETRDCLNEIIDEINGEKPVNIFEFLGNKGEGKSITLWGWANNKIKDKKNKLKSLQRNKIFPIIYDIEDWCHLKIRNEIDKVSIKKFMRVEFMYHMFKHYDDKDSFYKKIYDATILMDLKHWRKSKNREETFSNNGSFDKIEGKHKKRILDGGIKKYFKDTKEEIDRMEEINKNLDKKWKYSLDFLKSGNYGSVGMAWSEIYKRIIKVLKNPGITMENQSNPNIKILYILDGIDNFEITELLSEVAKELIRDIYSDKENYYIIALRKETKTYIDWKRKEMERQNSNKDNLPIVRSKKYFSPSPKDIKEKRFNDFIDKNEEFIKSIVKSTKPNSLEMLYLHILNITFSSNFTKLAIKKFEDTNMNIKVENTSEIVFHYDTRELLKYKFYLANHIFFRFLQSNKREYVKKYFLGEDSFCNRISNQKMKSVLFLKDHFFLKNEGERSPFVVYGENKQEGLYKIRILQFLLKYKKTGLEEEKIIKDINKIFFNSKYSKEILKVAISSLQQSRFIVSRFDSYGDEKIKYEITPRGELLLKLLFSDEIDILYYLALDTKMPRKFWGDENELDKYGRNDNDLIDSHTNEIREKKKIDTFYKENSIISAYTFILYLVEISKKELKENEEKIKENGYEIEDFELPFDFKKIERKINWEFFNDLKDKRNKLKEKFEIMGGYGNRKELEEDMKPILNPNNPKKFRNPRKI